MLELSQDHNNVYISLTLLLLPFIGYYICMAVYDVDLALSLSSSLCLLLVLIVTLITLAVTAFRDPGVMPRNAQFLADFSLLHEEYCAFVRQKKSDRQNQILGASQPHNHTDVQESAPLLVQGSLEEIEELHQPGHSNDQKLPAGNDKQQTVNQLNTAPQEPREPSLVQNFVLNNRVFKAPRCNTCGCCRPPGTSHCADCGCCVVYFDHHCGFLGRDVGIRTYPFFVAFLFMVVLSGLAMFGFSTACFVSLILRLKDEGRLSPINVFKLFGLVVCLLYGFVSALTVLNMLSYHCQLIKVDFTTRSDLRQRVNVAAQLQVFAGGESLEDEFFDYLMEQDFDLFRIKEKKLYKLIKNPGWRRVLFGWKMPAVQKLSCEAAERTAWAWTVVFS